MSVSERILNYDTILRVAGSGEVIGKGDRAVAVLDDRIQLYESEEALQGQEPTWSGERPDDDDDAAWLVNLLLDGVTETLCGDCLRPCAPDEDRCPHCGGETCYCGGCRQLLRELRAHDFTTGPFRAGVRYPVTSWTETEGAIWTNHCFHVG